MLHGRLYLRDVKFGEYLLIVWGHEAQQPLLQQKRSPNQVQLFEGGAGKRVTSH